MKFQAKEQAQGWAQGWAQDWAQATLGLGCLNRLVLPLMIFFYGNLGKLSQFHGRNENCH